MNSINSNSQSLAVPCLIRLRAYCPFDAHLVCEGTKVELESQNVLIVRLDNFPRNFETPNATFALLALQQSRAE